MALTCIHNHPIFQDLEQKAACFNEDRFHLKNLIQKPNRFKEFSLGSNGMFFDFSKQRLDKDVLEHLISLARETEAIKNFSKMVSGKIVNLTEHRAALHTGTREFTRTDLYSQNINIMEPITQVNDKIKTFTGLVNSQKIKGGTGKAFKDAVVIGIGGSYLGCEFVFEALKQKHDPKINLHFLANVDIDNFGQIIKKIDPETCLWIVISKSYTTTETMANLEQALQFLKTHELSPKDHLVTITAQGSPGDNPSNPVLACFHMFDFIGGRYSVSSAVGELPLGLAFGFDVFEKFLMGCHHMDCHALTAPPQKNIPLMAALISIWNVCFLDYSAQAIIPYSSGLSKLPAHVQQVYMESLGKMVTAKGVFLPRPSGSIIFGEPGTNAQHSFFQLAHQGPAFPIEFIGVASPSYKGSTARSKGVSNHQELWSNMLAQTTALAVGKEDEVSAKYFPGNRPSSIIVINELSAQNIGQLLSFYEARTIFEGFILGVNPFDQFGVELGKKLASQVRREIRSRNKSRDYGFTHLDESRQFYLETLFRGSLP